MTYKLTQTIGNGQNIVSIHLGGKVYTETIGFAELLGEDVKNKIIISAFKAFKNNAL